MIVSGHTDLQCVFITTEWALLEGLLKEHSAVCLKRICSHCSSSPDPPLPASLHPSSLSWCSRQSGPLDPDAEIDGKESTFRPPNAIQTRYSHNADLHCHNLSGRLTHHDVIDRGTLMCKCTVVTRDWWWCVIFFLACDVTVGNGLDLVSVTVD